MVKKISVLIVLSLLIIACNENDKPKKPDNLISKNKMSEILHDLYIINAAKGVNRKLLETNGFVPETYVLTKYNIDSAQFADSNTYYAFNTDVYKDIVDKVKARLEKEKEEFGELQKIEGKAAKRKRDSINKIKLSKKDSVKKPKRNFRFKVLDTIAIN
ncbi:DUF4296 domain-containing protein [uncultured Winogradskyella sp.]|uniref:DUF4296 domain-containing protein n=1 Tax=uncultured Winogradskyella sp. TaxID=395353 RepID=UPI0030D9F58B|tara:strand:+ start:38167 stop:38643 length:477 start_codon:yes stop_codon:yes gene_type:complete